MRRAVQRASKLVAITVLAAWALVPAGRADAALVCGYVQVLTTTVPLVSTCGPVDCPQMEIGPIGREPTEIFACIMA